MTSSSFGALTATTETNTALADNIEALANNGSEEEAADGTAGADGLLHSLVTADGGGGLSHQSHRQMKLNVIRKNRFNILRLHSLLVLSFTLSTVKVRRKSAPW